LPLELNAWISETAKDAALEKNWSQLEALNIFMAQLQTRLKKDVEQLESLSAKPSAAPQDVLVEADAVDRHTANAHLVWGYFRGKLEQRFVPLFGRRLRATDLIAHDCYRTILDRAEELGLVHHPGLRDYPLTFFQDEHTSAITRRRGTEIDRLDHRHLPLPIVGIPWDHQGSPWEFLSLHHEVAHDLDTDLGEVSSELKELIGKRLRRRRVPSERIKAWESWAPEIFADFLGTLLAGPAFVRFLANFLAWPKARVVEWGPGEPHPPPFLRILLDGQFVKALDCGQAAAGYVNRLVGEWKSLYNPPPIELSAFIADFDVVIGSILDSRLNRLKDDSGKKHSIRSLVAFTEADFKAQQKLSEVLLDGSHLPSEGTLRHVPGAAFLAMEKVDGTRAASADQVSDSAITQILELAPPGQLAIRSKASTDHLKFLANAYYDAPHGPLRGRLR
jgi:hypothetical protein